MSQGKDSHDGTPGGQGKRFPVKVAGPDVRLGKDDERNWLVAGGKPKLIGRDAHSQGRTPIVLIDGREAEVTVVVHTEIVVGPATCSWAGCRNACRASSGQWVRPGSGNPMASPHFGSSRHHGWPEAGGQWTPDFAAKDSDWCGQEAA